MDEDVLSEGAAAGIVAYKMLPLILAFLLIPGSAQPEAVQSILDELRCSFEINAALVAQTSGEQQLLRAVLAKVAELTECLAPLLHPSED